MYEGDWEFNMCHGSGISYDKKGSVLHSGHFFKNHAEHHCCSRFCKLFGFGGQGAVDNTFKIWTSDGQNAFRLGNFNNQVMWRRDSLPISQRCIGTDKDRVMTEKRATLQREKSFAKSTFLSQDREPNKEPIDNKIIPMSIKS
jgi:hypothetical protein